jgi:outer membrane protein assembly factor BamB
MRPLPVLLACVLLPALSLSAQPAAPDSIEGKWLGSVGHPAANNLSVLGLEFRRDPAGALSFALTLEQLNLYSQSIPETITHQGRRYSCGTFDLELKDGQLSGTFGADQLPVTLTRVEQLPTDAPLPTHLPAAPTPKWQTQLGGSLYASPAAHGDRAYLGTTSGVFVAVKTADGSVAWSFPAGRPVFGEALPTDDAVFFVCDNGYLFKLARADGKELWRYDLGDARVPRILPDPVQQSEDGFDHRAPRPVLADGVLYVGAGDGGFHAVRADTGERVWRMQSKGAIRTDAVVRGPHVFYSTIGGLIVAAERTTGQTLWEIKSPSPVTGSPVFVGDKLVIGGRDSVLQALDPATGAQLWKLGFWGSWVESTAVPAPENNGVAYIGSSDLRRVTAFDANTGRILWRTDVFGSSWGRPLVTEKTIYVALCAEEPYAIRHQGGLAALDRASGKLMWRLATPNPAGTYSWGFTGSPARAGNSLLIGGLNGTLYAFPVE